MLSGSSYRHFLISGYSWWNVEINCCRWNCNQIEIFSSFLTSPTNFRVIWWFLNVVGVIYDFGNSEFSRQINLTWWNQIFWSSVQIYDDFDIFIQESYCTLETLGGLPGDVTVVMRGSWWYYQTMPFGLFGTSFWSLFKTQVSLKGWIRPSIYGSLENAVG